MLFKEATLPQEGFTLPLGVYRVIDDAMDIWNSMPNKFENLPAAQDHIDESFDNT